MRKRGKQRERERRQKTKEKGSRMMVEDVGGSKVKKNEKVGPPTAGNRAPAPYTQGASASR